ncbi:MAG: DUF72 domain-containing protein [Rhodanobacter sp.]
MITRRTDQSQIRVGIGGWSYAPWRDNFYPAGLVQRRELEYASQHLRTIEINGTFYRAQKPATYASWAAQTPDGFVFSLKAPRYVMATRQLAKVRKGIHAFIHGGLAELGDRLGPILWQLPPTRVFDADELASFLDALPGQLEGRTLRHVLEVRHASFDCEGYVALARERQVATVFTDSADYLGIADCTADFIYARLMRSTDNKPEGYAPSALERWTRRARDWAAGKDIAALPHAAAVQRGGAARDVFIYFISAAKQRNPAAAMALQARVDAKR